MAEEHPRPRARPGLPATRTRVAVLVLAGALVVATLAASPARAVPVPPPPPPDPVPIAGCDWYGTLEAEYTTDLTYPWGDDGQQFFDGTERATFSSAPVTDDYVCPAQASAYGRWSEFRYEDVGCGLGQTGREYYNEVLEYSGTAAGGLLAEVRDGSAGPTLFVAASTPHGAITGTETRESQDVSWVDCEGSTSQSQFDAPVQFTIRSTDWSDCQDELAVADPSVEVLVGACVIRYEDEGGHTESSFSWSLMRADCDPTVDTDGGGIGDCDEAAAGTDPNDPEDDAPETECNDETDNDGDSLADVGDDPGCASEDDTSEHGTNECDNGLDDDGDGKVDYRESAGVGDPDCLQVTGEHELGCTANEPPTGVELFASPQDWTQGLSSGGGVTMDFAGIGNDPEGGPLLWTWGFHDHTGTIDRSGKTTTYRWPTDGTPQERVVTVTATDPCGGTASNVLALDISGDPDEDFAPIIGVHPKEPYLPMSATSFIAGSALKYRGVKTRGKETTVVARGKINAAKLGSGGYRVRQPVAPYDGKRRTVTTDDHTRPWSEGNVGSRIGLDKDGFALDVADSIRTGDERGGWPVYLQKVGSRNVYWTFYGLSQLLLRGAVPQPIKHEGDWERIIVELSSKKVPTRVGYVAHHYPVAYDDYPDGIYSTPPGTRPGYVNTDGLAPLGYSALRGHGTYPTAGMTCIKKVACDYRSSQGIRWIARDNLVDIAKMSWFGSPQQHSACRKGAPMPANSLRCGFGGAWGDLGSQKGALGPDSTGPLGPSAYKSATTN